MEKQITFQGKYVSIDAAIATIHAVIRTASAFGAAPVQWPGLIELSLRDLPRFHAQRPVPLPRPLLSTRPPSSSRSSVQNDSDASSRPASSHSRESETAIFDHASGVKYYDISKDDSYEKGTSDVSDENRIIPNENRYISKENGNTSNKNGNIYDSSGNISNENADASISNGNCIISNEIRNIPSDHRVISNENRNIPNENRDINVAHDTEDALELPCHQESPSEKADTPDNPDEAFANAIRMLQATMQTKMANLATKADIENVGANCSVYSQQA